MRAKTLDLKRFFLIVIIIHCLLGALWYLFWSNFNLFGAKVQDVDPNTYFLCAISILAGFLCYHGGAKGYQFAALFFIACGFTLLTTICVTKVNRDIDDREYAKYGHLCASTVVGVNNQNIIPAAGPSEKFNDGKVEITLSKKIDYPLSHSNVFHYYKRTLLVTAKNLSDKTAEYTLSLAITGPELRGLHYAALRIDDVAPGKTRTVNAFSDYLESYSKHLDIMSKSTSFKVYSVRTRTKNAQGVLEPDDQFHGVNILFNPTPEDLRGII